MKKKPKWSVLRNEQGISIIIVVIFLSSVGLVIAAFVMDFGYYYVAKNQLQNAADAAALAGARALYYEDGTGVNHDGGDPTGLWTDSANKIAYYSATENKSTGKAVELYEDGSGGTTPWNPVSSGNVGDIQRGHWSFATHTFTKDDSTDAIDLGSYTTEELDLDCCDSSGGPIHFINAVKVTTRRQASPVRTFFANIFGFQSFIISADAVGYRGFAGTLAPGEADIPIAVCIQSICDVNEGENFCSSEIHCSYGRMLNSGNNNNDHNTSGWTNFTEDCVTANPSNMEPILDGCVGNPDIITLGGTIGTTGGVDLPILTHNSKPNLINCWKNGLYDIDRDGDATEDIPIVGSSGMPEYPWEVHVPVIDCPGNNVGNCSDVLGSMKVTVIWILVKENDIDADAPYKMWNPNTVNENGTKGAFWENNNPDGVARWNDFVDEFKLEMVDEQPAYYVPPPDSDKLSGFKQKSVYFLPECDKSEPAGGTGGQNFGVLARIPVLVE